MSSIFHLYTCNNLVDLAACYAEHRHHYPGSFMSSDLFAAEQVVVPTKGMAIWLEQFLAKQGQIVINMQFPYIRDQVNAILNHHFQADSSFQPQLFTTPVMTWRILAFLQQNLQLFPDLAPYLQPEHAANDDSLEQRRYQLALRIAEVFDQYMVYKPDMLCQKGEGTWKNLSPNNQWQKTLWQQLCQWQGEKITSPADKIMDFFQLSDAEMPTGLQPQTVFGVSIMSPVFLNFFKKLSATTEVHFFYLNPCDAFWADQKSSWALQQSLIESPELDLHFENTLLGDFGQQGRNFFRAILELDDNIDERSWEPTSPAGAEAATNTDTLMKRIQQAIRTRTTPEAKTTLAESDDSLTIHNCHHDLRQIEVLHDHLLALLQTGKYQLNDILVMAPDISQFANTIQAVFDQGPLRHRYAISDRSIKHTNLLARAFLSILEISDSRYELSRVQKLLEVPALRRRFRFRDQDEATLNDWFSACKIRWGLTAEDRKKNLDFAFEQYSWQHGLNRLLLGLALEEDDHLEAKSPLADIRPLNYADATENMTLLGNFCVFLKMLQDFAEDSQEPKTIDQWQQLLNDLLTDFFLPDSDSASDYSLMRRTVNELHTAISQSEYHDLPLSFSVVKSALSSALENAAPYSPFLSGKITFCSMIPMRGIPGQVIALLGLDEDAFPRSTSHLGFNLIADELETTFRSRQLEDRYLFLEAILAAQDKLLIYYRGQDEHRQRDYLPSVVIAELLDFADKITDGGDLHNSLVIKHRLQGFDPHYFRQARLQPEGFLRQPFSYHQAYACIATAIDAPETLSLISEEETRQSYFKPMSLLQPETDQMTVTLAELEHFFRNPSQAFLTDAMNFPPPKWDNSFFSDFEPFNLNDLEKVAAVRTLAQELCRFEDFPDLDNDQIINFQENFSQRNLLPIGALGKQTFQQMITDAWIENQELRQQWANQKEDKREVSIDLLPNTFSDLQKQAHLDYLSISEPSAIDTAYHDFFHNYLKSSLKIPSSFRVTVADKVPAAADGSSHLNFCFSGLSARHRIRFCLRHLLLCATGQGQAGSTLYGKDDSLFVLDGIAQSEAVDYLQKMLVCYLLGKKIPLPIFAEYSLQLAAEQEKASKSAYYDGFRQIGDATDFYVRHLWGQNVNGLPKITQFLASYCYQCLRVQKEIESAKQ